MQARRPHSSPESRPAVVEDVFLRNSPLAGACTDVESSLRSRPRIFHEETSSLQRWRRALKEGGFWATNRERERRHTACQPPQLLIMSGIRVNVSGKPPRYFDVFSAMFASAMDFPYTFPGVVGVGRCAWTEC